MLKEETPQTGSSNGQRAEGGGVGVIFRCLRGFEVCLSVSRIE